MSIPPPPPSSPPPQPPSPPPSSTFNLQLEFILTEILPKLPAKSLLRFKSVCKPFYNLISSPEFIRHHLRHSLSSDNHRMLAVSPYNLLSLDLHSLSTSATFSWPEQFPLLVGSCNGLLLITGLFSNHRRLVVLNPSIRTYVDVPSTATNPGFGFDHLTDDYKIVVVTDDHSTAITTRTTRVYSVNSKSHRLVESTTPADTLEGRNGGVLINNHLLHWMFWSPSKRKRRIGCFDVCLEKWADDVLLPPYYYDPSHRNYLLDFGVLDGRLFSLFESPDDSTYDIWVMKEYGVQESWMKLFSIAISKELSGGVVPVACIGSGLSKTILLRQRHESKLFWYSCVDGVLSEVNVPYFCARQPYICKGSLVSLPGAKFFADVYEPDELAQQLSAWTL